MSNQAEQRRLTLEQLERRTLLAGDLFFDFFDFDSDDHRRSRDRSHHGSSDRAFQRTFGIDRYGEDRDRDDDDRQSRRSFRSGDRFEDFHDRSDSFQDRTDYSQTLRSNSQPEGELIQGELIEVMFVFHIPVRFVTVSTMPTESNLQIPGSSSAVEMGSMTPAVDTPSLGSFGNGNRSASRTAASSRTPAVEPQRLETTAVQRVAAGEDRSTEPTQPSGTESTEYRLIPVRVGITADELSYLREYNAGLIDPGTREVATSDISQPLEQRSPWRLPQQTLERLQDTLDHLQQQDGIAPDELAIATWFAGPGGLIDFGGASLDLQSADGAVILVDVELDTALGLHRSLELLAADQCVPKDDAVRDAVLAALLSEELEIAQPVAEATPVRVPTVAYPSAVILAALAIAGQRKRAKDLEIQDEDGEDED